MDRYLVVTLVGLLAGCATTPSTPPAEIVCTETECSPDQVEVVLAGKRVAASKLNVPSKAEFGPAHLARNGTLDIVCGKLTGVNALGGYPPMRAFYVMDGEAHLEPQSSQLADGVETLGDAFKLIAFQSDYSKHCGREAD